MAKLNIDTISFLVGSLNSVVQNFGTNSKSVTFYKQQVQALVNIGQIGVSETEFVYRLAGMENTEAVKWDKTIRRMNEFIECMNYLYKKKFASSDSIKTVLNALKSKGIMTELSEKYIKEIYDIDFLDTEIKLPDKGNSFGTLNTQIEGSSSLNSDKSSDVNSSEIEKLKSFLSTCHGKYFRIRNLSAVCSCDVSVYTVEIYRNIEKTINNLSKYTPDMRDDTIKICNKKETSDGCHSSTYYSENEKLTDKFKAYINISKLKEELRLWNKKIY